MAKTAAGPARIPAPGFKVTDAEGDTISLADFKDKKHVVLVFNRGFGCPFCRRHMAELRRDYPRFVQRGAVVIAIGPEDEDTFTHWWISHRMPFLGIPDPEHKIADLYGQQAKFYLLGRVPEIVIVDRDGYLRMTRHSWWMSDIPSNRDLLRELDEINAEMGPVEKRKKG